MGLYSTVSFSGREGQVKLWNDSLEMSLLYIGSRVPEIAGHDTYSVGMREGGFLHVRGCVLEDWADEPMPDFMILDKWGGPWDGNNYGSDDPFSAPNLRKEAGLEP